VRFNDACIPGDGRRKLDFIDVRDAAAVIVGLVETDPESWPEVINVGSGRQVTRTAGDSCSDSTIGIRYCIGSI